MNISGLKNNKDMNSLLVCNKEIKEVDPDGTVLFYANVFNNTDSDGDLSLPGSFSKTLKENASRLRHLKYHDTRLMPGVIKEATEDQVGLLIKSQLILNTQLGKETYEEYKAMHEAGKQMEHSVRVNPVKYAEDRTDPNNVIRKVSEWKLWEVSTLTAWGANSQALSISVKNMKDATREDLESELTYLKALLNIQSYSDYKLESIEKQISYLLKLKAALQPGDTTDSRTLQEKMNEVINQLKNR